MMAQGILPFRYEGEPTASGMTALAGLPPSLELAVVSGLTDSIRRRLKVCADQKQGWTDSQIVMPLVLLNVAGGNFVDDLRILEGDEGFVKLLRRVEHNMGCGVRSAERWIGAGGRNENEQYPLNPWFFAIWGHMTIQPRRQSG
jgi:hypothetical protein